MSSHKVNTVLGPISTENMGITLMHEHVFFGMPGWEGDKSVAPLNHKELVDTGVVGMKELKEYGVKTFVDVTPNDCGRMVNVLKDVSERSGVNIICSTGYYFEAEGAPTYFKFRKLVGHDVENEIYEMFMKEVTEGIEGTEVKAGVIKVATSEGKITEYERWFLDAAAKVHKNTGVPIITHTQKGSMGPEQAEILVKAGVDSKHIGIGHMCDNLDINYQIRTLKDAGYILWDRMGVQGVAGLPLDVDRYSVLAEMIYRGYADRIMLSHDSAMRWLGRPLVPSPELQALLVNSHPTHLFKNVIPALKGRGVTDVQVKTIIEDNPRRFFGGKQKKDEKLTV